jgi:pimeloyl-ACP methyl ester carboxylesterase
MTITELAPSTARPFPPVPGMTHGFVTVNGVRLHTAEAGAGEPVIFLHGFPQHWYAWRHVIPLLAGEYRLICVDQRGFGWSGAPPGGYDSATQVADVLALMDALGLVKTRLVGHEFGGRTALMCALAAPERVSHLLILNSAHPWMRQRRLIPAMWRFWYTALLEYPGIGRQVLRRWPGFTRFLLRHGLARPGTADPAATEEFVAAIREPTRARAGEALHWQYVLHDIPALILRRHRAARLTVPTVLLAGEADPFLPPALLDGLAPHADDASVRVIPSAGHYLAEERPDVVAAAARELFRRP